MKARKFFSLLLLSGFIFGCGQRQKNNGAQTSEAFAAKEAVNNEASIVERKLIKEGQVSFETTSIGATRKRVLDAVEKYKGYIASDQEYKETGRTSNTIIIRVPADSFDSLLKEATSGIDRFERKDISIRDVTEEFVDVQARLKTKKELESRYKDLMKAAKTVTEMLEIEKQVGELRSEIESIEGRLNYLQSQVALSTLSMNFFEQTPGETQFGTDFKKGLINGWNNLVLFFILLVNIWPFILIAIVAFFGLRFYRKK